MKKNLELAIPEYAFKALDTLLSQGFSAFFVGGCVRDILLGRSPEDFDIAASSLPHETERCFKNHLIISDGKAHGTVAVIIDEKKVEITTFRCDGNYTDGRRPDTVSFTADIKDDLVRRDFTVNAIAFSPKSGIVDPLLGRRDLENGVLRAVGDPEKRFSEDSLRILRGLRFAAVYGFSIEERTLDAMNALAPTLFGTSKERQWAELRRLITGEFCERAIGLAPAVISQILPNTGHGLPLDLLGGRESVRLAALLFGSGNPTQALKTLTVEKKTIKAVEVFLSLMNEPLPTDTPGIKRLIARLGSQDFTDLVALKKAMDSGINYKNILKTAKKIKGECIALKDLSLNGRDLIGLGFKPGKKLGKALDYLLDEVINGRVPNTKEELTKAALHYIK